MLSAKDGLQSRQPEQHNIKLIQLICLGANIENKAWKLVESMEMGVRKKEAKGQKICLFHMPNSGQESIVVVFVILQLIGMVHSMKKAGDWSIKIEKESKLKADSNFHDN